AGLSERMLTLDPANHYSISATSVLRHIYDPLIEVTNDSKFVPCLAESWTPVNNTTWRFNLRKGVKFHDGTPFTADSVIYSLKRPRDNTKLIKSFAYQDIEDVRKDGDFTAIAPDDAGHAASDGRRERGGILQEAGRDRPLQVRWVDPRRDHHPQRQLGL